MNATHVAFYLIQKNQTTDVSYTIFPVKKNKCWKFFKNYEKIVIELFFLFTS
jgi:hypothetical protein